MHKNPWLHMWSVNIFYSVVCLFTLMHKRFKLCCSPIHFFCACQCFWCHIQESMSILNFKVMNSYGLYSLCFRTGMIIPAIHHVWNVGLIHLDSAVCDFKMKLHLFFVTKLSLTHLLKCSSFQAFPWLFLEVSAGISSCAPEHSLHAVAFWPKPLCGQWL